MSRQLRIALALTAWIALLTWAGLAALRAAHPGVLEWQEGGMLAHLARVRGGQALFVEPSPEFIAFPYPPLFVWVASLVGEGLVALRAVSIASTAAVLLLLFAHARRATDCRLAGLVAAGVFAASYRWAGAWFDVGRVDMLALALALASLHVARFRGGLGAALLAGTLCGLAFLTKQTAVLVSAPMVVHLARRSRRDALAFGAAAAAVGGGGVLALHLASDGWSTWTLFELLAGHPWFEPASIWTRDLPWLLPAGFLALCTRLPLAPALGMLAAAWLGRAHQGGAENTLLPMALLAALVVGEAVGRARGRSWILVLALLQLVMLAYDPRPLVPRAADAEQAAHLRARLAALEGPVFAPHQPQLVEEPCAHAQAIVDLLSSTHARDQAQVFVARLGGALRRGDYAAVLLAEPWEDLPGLAERYPVREDLLEGQAPERLRPVTGHPHRPRWLFLPAD